MLVVCLPAMVLAVVMLVVGIMLVIRLPAAVITLVTGITLVIPCLAGTTLVVHLPAVVLAVIMLVMPGLPLESGSWHVHASCADSCCFVAGVNARAII